MNCGNCDHPAGVHGASGCRTGFCDCLFDYAPVSREQVGGSHYQEMPIQPWAIIDAFGLDFYAGSALKYLLRAGRKGSRVEDLKKCQHYLAKMIELEEGGQ